jgi:hypothetical protein
MTQPPTSLSEAQLESLPGPRSSWRTGHDVQFYDNEEFLVARATDFLREGLRAGQPIIVICTEGHRRGFLKALSTAPEYRMEGAEITWLDARQTLAAFMNGPVPDPELFRATIGNVFEKTLANRSYIVVRGYGEMVDLLCKDGNTEGALALEALWNGLAAKYAFNLLCAYSLGNFMKESNTDCMKRICACHGRVSSATTVDQA